MEELGIVTRSGLEEIPRKFLLAQVTPRTSRLEIDYFLSSRIKGKITIKKGDIFLVLQLDELLNLMSIQVKEDAYIKIGECKEHPTDLVRRKFNNPSRNFEIYITMKNLSLETEERTYVPAMTKNDVIMFRRSNWVRRIPGVTRPLVSPSPIGSPERRTSSGNEDSETSSRNGRRNRQSSHSPDSRMSHRNSRENRTPSPPNPNRRQRRRPASRENLEETLPLRNRGRSPQDQMRPYEEDRSRRRHSLEHRRHRSTSRDGAASRAHRRRSPSSSPPQYQRYWEREDTLSRDTRSSRRRQESIFLEESDHDRRSNRRRSASPVRRQRCRESSPSSATSDRSPPRRGGRSHNASIRDYQYTGAISRQTDTRGRESAGSRENHGNRRSNYSDVSGVGPLNHSSSTQERTDAISKVLEAFSVKSTVVVPGAKADRSRNKQDYDKTPRQRLAMTSTNGKGEKSKTANNVEADSGNRSNQRSRREEIDTVSTDDQTDNANQKNQSSARGSEKSAEEAQQQARIKKMEKEIQKLKDLRARDSEELKRFRDLAQQKSNTDYLSVIDETGLSENRPAPGFRAEKPRTPFPTTSTLRPTSTPAMGLGATLNINESAITPSATPNETPAVTPGKSMTDKVLERSRAGVSNPFISTDEEDGEIYLRDPNQIPQNTELETILKKLESPDENAVKDALGELAFWRDTFEPDITTPEGRQQIDCLPIALTRIAHRMTDEGRSQELKDNFVQMGKKLYKVWNSLEQKSNRGYTQELKAVLETRKQTYKEAGFSESAVSEKSNDTLPE